MKRVTCFVALILLLVPMTGDIWAKTKPGDPEIFAITDFEFERVDPPGGVSLILVNEATKVIFTFTVSDPDNLKLDSVKIERFKDPPGKFQLLSISDLTFESRSGDVFRFSRVFNEDFSFYVGGRFRLTAVFEDITDQKGRSISSPEFGLRAGFSISKEDSDAADVPTECPDRVDAIIKEGSATTDITVSCETITDTIFRLTVVPTNSQGGDLDLLEESLKLRITPPAGAALGDRFVITQQTAGDTGLQAIPIETCTVKVFTDPETGVPRAVCETDDDVNVSILSGFQDSEGVFVLVPFDGTGWVIGQVTDTSANPRPGVWVTNTNPATNREPPQGSYTDADGRYIVPVYGEVSGPDNDFTIEATDGFRRAKGVITGDLPNVTGPQPHEDPIATGVNIVLDTASPPTRDGCRNCGFELGDLTAWSASGTVAVVGPSSTVTYSDVFGFATTFGPSQGAVQVSTPITDAADNGSGEVRITSTTHGLETGDLVTIVGVAGTTEANGNWNITRVDDDNFDLDGSIFANTFDDSDSRPIAVGPPAGGHFVVLRTATSSLGQEFILPDLLEEARKVRMDLAFACPSDGTCPTIPPTSLVKMRAELFEVPDSGPDISRGFVEETFKGDFGGQLAWHTRDIPIDLAVTPAGTLMKLKIELVNSAENIAGLVDNVRFNTAFAVANILDGAFTTVDAVKEQMANSREILSQVGTSLQITRINTKVDPFTPRCNPDVPSGTGLDFFGDDGVDVTWATAERTLPNGIEDLRGIVTDEAKAVLCTGPETNPDLPRSYVHVYYVNAIKDSTSPVNGWAFTTQDYHGETTAALLNYDADDTCCTAGSAPFFNNETGVILADLTDPQDAIYVPAHEFAHMFNARKVAHGSEHPAPAGITQTTQNSCDPVVSTALPSGADTTICYSRPTLTTRPFALDALGNQFQPGSFDLPDPSATDPSRCPVTCQQ